MFYSARQSIAMLGIIQSLVVNLLGAVHPGPESTGDCICN